MNTDESGHFNPESEPGAGMPAAGKGAADPWPLESRRRPAAGPPGEIDPGAPGAGVTPALYADLYDFAPVAYLTLAPDGRIHMANFAAAGLLGRSPAALHGGNLRVFVAQDSVPTFNFFMGRALSSERRQSCKLNLLGASGIISVHLEGIADHRRAECRVAIMDIAERTQSAASRESEQRFRVALANSPITVFEQDLGLRYTWINNPMAGLAVEDVIGRHNSDLMSIESAEQLDTLMGGAIASARGGRAEVRVDMPEREGIYWDFSFQPRQDAAGKVVGIIGTAMDITERKQGEQALREAKNESERADNAKSRFLAAASHDLRQPLAALALYVDLLKTKIAAKDAILVDRMKGCVTGMSALLNDLLDVSKLMAGVVQPQATDFSIDDMIGHLVDIHAPEARLKHLRIRHVCCGLTARTDPVWFSRMLGNLIANAVEYTERGGILIACRRREGKMWVEVHDTGIGIPEGQTSEIFEEFRQLDDTARTRGSGLGLAIIARAAALLGLRIRVRSKVGRGSVFAVELPLGVPTEEIGAISPVGPGRTLSIALVEDNPAVLEALSALFQTSGHRVLAASSKHDLLESLNDVVPDIIISDYRLPEENGFDVINGVRDAVGENLPAIILTGDTDPGLMAEMSRHGIVIQHKPIDAAVLEQCIAEATK